MAATQLARGIWTGFAATERAFGVPNGMDENLRTIDDHMGLYTLQAPLPAGSVLPASPVPGAGQIFSDGGYAVFNSGAWKVYAPRVGVVAAAIDGGFPWHNTGSGWEQRDPEVYFDQAGIGAVRRTMQDKMRERVSVKDFGAKGDGVTDDTLAINRANAAAVLSGRKLFWPAGVYISGSIPAIAKMHWYSDGSACTTIKLKDGANAGLITSPSNEMNDVTLEGFTLDGNRAHNAAGDVLRIVGVSSKFVDLVVINAPQAGIITDWNPSTENQTRREGFQGYYEDVRINACGASGWIHNGPSDSTFISTIIIDAGLSANDTHYGLYLAPGSGNGKFYGLHVWNMYFTANVPRASVYIGSSANTFCGVVIEGGVMGLNIVGSGNALAACQLYAPRGAYTAQLASSAVGNNIQATLGAVAFGGNLAYKGVLLQGPANTLDLTAIGTGCTLGVVDFSGSTGRNVVRVTGYQATGVALSGTPHDMDDVTVLVTGILGGDYVQRPAIPWFTWFVPAVAPSATPGAFAATASCRFKNDGKRRELTVDVAIGANGTGTGYLGVSVPVQASGLGGLIPGINNTTRKALTGRIEPGSSVMRIVDSEGAYPVATGDTITMHGSYESV